MVVHGWRALCDRSFRHHRQQRSRIPDVSGLCRLFRGRCAGALPVDDNWSISLGIDNLNNDKYFLFHPFPQRTAIVEIHFRQ
jgi:hypothetical protein